MKSDAIVRMDMGSEEDDMVLTWATDRGSAYDVRVCTSLVDGVWDPIITNIPGTGTEGSITTFVSGDSLFYRVALEE